MDNQVILVIGATGNVGRHIVTQLRDLGVSVRALSRNPASRNPASRNPASRDPARLPAGVTAVAGDLTRPETVRAAAAGVDAAFLLWPFRTADGADAAVAALASQAPRIVYLSAISVRDGAPPEQNGVWGRVEQAIERSGAGWTFLRAGGFATNTLGWAGEIRSQGVVRWAYGQAARSLIHERDIADVAVRALTDAKHAGAKYVLTGPAAVTQADQARLIGEATGLPVRWEETPAEEVLGQLAAVTGDRAFAAHALDYWASLVDQPEPVTPAVPEITGHPARTFAEWASDHAADFRPRSPEETGARYVSLFRQGDVAGAVRLLAPDVVRVAPLEPDGGGAAGLRGVRAIMENGRRHEVRTVEVDGPYPHGDRFAVRFVLDGVAKMSLCTVRDGLIVSEDVFYHTPPRR